MDGVPANVQDSDATLLRRLRHGDSIAFSQLSRKHEPKILAVSRRILRNREDAEDNAQSTLMRAYFNCNQFRGRSQFSTWLVRVAINEALMRLRRRNANKGLVSAQSRKMMNFYLRFAISQTSPIKSANTLPRI